MSAPPRPVNYPSFHLTTCDLHRSDGIFSHFAGPFLHLGHLPPRTVMNGHRGQFSGARDRPQTSSGSRSWPTSLGAGPGSALQRVKLGSGSPKSRPVPAVTDIPLDALGFTRLRWHSNRFSRSVDGDGRKVA